MNQERAAALDHRVVVIYKLLAQQHGWVTRMMRPGCRSILSCPPSSRSWDGVLVDFSGDESLHIHCSGRAAETFRTTVDLLQVEPTRIAEILVHIAAYHAAVEEKLAG